MMKREPYELSKLEIIRFTEEDVIMTSPINTGTSDPDELPFVPAN